MSGGLHWTALPAGRVFSVRDQESPASDGTHWAVLGGVAVVWTQGDGAEERVRRSGAKPEAATDLALVTQVGRSFQNEYPDVRVLVEHGRHLVIDSGTLPRLARTETNCWRVGPLPTDTVVVGRPEPAARRADPDTLALLALLSRSALESDLTSLVNRGTRHSLSAEFAAAAAWAEDRLSSLGYAVARRPITVRSGGQSQNVVAERTGTAAGVRDIVVVTAHLDSINLAGASAAAPGADDNGSGATGLLELARVLATRQWGHDLRLVLFGGEEQGLFGSLQFVAAMPPGERARVRAVLNMDMIATRNTVQPTVMLEGHAISKLLIDQLAVAAATYTGLRVETSLSPFASDHVPFIDAGMPAVLTIEGSDRANENVHTAQDTLAHIDFTLMQEILRMNLAALAGWLTPVAGTPRRGGSMMSPAADRVPMSAIGPDSARR